MNLPSFIQTRQPNWVRLQALLARLQSSPVHRFNRADLKEFGQLYRTVSSDLACAQTHFPQSHVTRLLNELVARAHQYVYRPKIFTWRSLVEFYGWELPSIFRLNLGYFWVSTGLFALAVLMGWAATMANEDVAQVFLNPAIIDRIHQGEMWTKSVFDVVPSSVASSWLLANNISVSFLAFAAGVTCGLGTAWVLVTNGLMLGVVCGLCTRYGMTADLIGFVAAHGVLEISVILIAGTAGLMLGTAVLHPGDLTRRDALAMQGAHGAKLVFGCAPMLVVAGLVEGYVSLSAIPASAKIALGLCLGAALYAYLFAAGRLRPSSPGRGRVP